MISLSLSLRYSIFRLKKKKKHTEKQNLQTGKAAKGTSVIHRMTDGKAAKGITSLAALTLINTGVIGFVWRSSSPTTSLLSLLHRTNCLKRGTSMTDVSLSPGGKSSPSRILLPCILGRYGGQVIFSVVKI